jgi:hypothetical protein
MTREKGQPRCPSTVQGGGQNPRTERCQQPAGHEGRCSYHRVGGQGGSLRRWWGANPQPKGDLSTMTTYDRELEIYRLRELLDRAGIEW